MKSIRDDFDQLFEHRVCWHNVELSKSHLEIVENLIILVKKQT